MRVDLALRCLSPLTSHLFSGEGLLFVKEHPPTPGISALSLSLISGTHPWKGMYSVFLNEMKSLPIQISL